MLNDLHRLPVCCVFDIYDMYILHQEDRTPLHAAAEGGYFAVVEALLSAGATASVNAKDRVSMYVYLV